MIAVSTKRASERGFALLIIFLMAASIAMMLYMQLPRVAFESERDKEQLLIDRGEQYKRAIQLYVQANRRFPTSLDDLEQRDKRFLRRRYVDPYTGKAEWRLIHSNGQYLTDSLVQKPPDPNATQTASTTGSSSSSTADGQPTVNAAVSSRPSDRLFVLTQTGATGPVTLTDPNNPAAYPGSQIGDGKQFPPMNVQQLQQQQQQVGGIQATIPGGIPSQPLPGQVSGQPTVAGLPILQPGASPGFRTDANGQVVAIGPNEKVGNPGAAAAGAPITPSPAAMGIIGTMLTSGRPQTQQASNPALLQNNNNAIGGGIAGVASSHEGPSIKVYNNNQTYADQQTYQTWEFIVQLAAGAAGAPGGTGGPPMTGTPGGPGAQGGPNAPGQGRGGGGALTAPTPR